MSLLLPVLTFAVVIGGFYVFVTRRTAPKDGVAFLLAIAAGIPLMDGCLLLNRELSRRQDGRVVAGVVVEKLSSTGAASSRTIGGSRRWRRSRAMPTIVTSNGFEFHDVLARLILTGSPDAWVIAYRYPCSTSGECRQREFVSHDLWSGLQAGQMVNVRTDGDQNQGRLDENPALSTAIAKVGIGATLGVVAGFVSGRLTLRRRRRYVTAPAVVTAVDPVTLGGEVRWRVRFAYFCADGTACESIDEVSVKRLKPGDDCIAVFPPEHPDLGTLRLIGPEA